MTRSFAVVVLAGIVVAAGCTRQAEERTSMPDDRKVLMDSMPAGPPEDSMAAEMERAWKGDSVR
jgi:hypothetical protein